MEQPNTYEEAFSELEKILHKLNEGKASLEDSLTLFTKANHLITFCNKKLFSAEKQIEELIKNRDGSIAVDKDNSLQTKDFSSSPGHMLHE